MLKGYEKHKDAKPLETIIKIRNILSDLDILVIESEWKISLDNYYSVRLVMDELGIDVGANGKGLSREFALASAYSEFIERLQNHMILKKNFGLMKEIECSYLDSKYLSNDELIDNCESIIKQATNGTNDPNLFTISDRTLCYSFNDVLNNKLSYLPKSILNITGSNGMCAGNTPQEAIVQGICEIFERYSVRYIYENKISVPTIPVETVLKLDIYEYIKALEEKGYSIVIKDCTLSGFIPVLAVIMFNRDFTKCLIRFGSDPNFEIALMRCISEGFQGASDYDLETNMITFDILENKPYKTGNKAPDDFWSCIFLKDFILSEAVPNYVNAFENEFTSNQESLDFLINKIRGNRNLIYIKDVSYLGFPSYYIYIPGLSEFYGNEYAYIYLTTGQKIRPVLLNLPCSNSSDISRCIDSIEDFLSYPLSSFLYSNDYGSFTKDFASINLKQNSDLYSLSINYLLSLLNLRVENYKKAAYYLNCHLELLKESNISLTNLNYYKCVLFYLELRSINKDETSIFHSLKSIFGQSLVEEVIEDTKNPEKVFQYLKLPTCGNCNSCKIQDDCYYYNWKRTVNKLNEKMKQNPIDQMKLSKIFNNR